MNIKERALNAVKQNYAKFGLKPEELERLADHIAGGLTEETTDEQLNTAIAGAQFYAEMMQSVGNRKATEVQNKYKDYIPKPATPQTPPSTPPATPPTGAMTAEEVRKLIEEANKERQKEIDAAVAKATAPFLEAQQKARLGALLQGHAKLKDIPEVFRAKYHLDKEEDLETVASQIESDYTAFKQELVRSGQFVEAPAKPTPESEQDDFIKKMESYGERHSAEPSK